MKTYSRKQKPEDANLIIVDLNEICRLCMAKEDELVPIFSNDDSIPLTLRIMACCALEVVEGDGLPDKICHPCRYQLEKSYTFRKKCETSDMKLRQHMNVKLPIDITPEEAEDQSNTIEDVESNARTEQDLVGITQVAYIHPEELDHEDSPGDITLPQESDGLNKEACTINTTVPMKTERVEAEGGEEEGVFLMDTNYEQEQEEEQLIEDQDLEAIAEAVKNTLASHPNLSLSGELQMKVDQQPGKPTQVQVTTEDGSVILMELMTEDNQETAVPIGEPREINEDGELKVFQCPKCPKSFARRIQLKRHSSVHMQQRGFSCGICEKWFPTRSALVRHERIHTGERPFQCEVCQKSFAQKEILYRHLMTHTGQKPYSCPHCPKGFTQKEPLRVHLRTHLNTNPSDIQLHCCTLCPKVFCHASGLSRHLVTHTGKTFKCRDCDKAFTDKSSLKRHHRQTMHQP